MNKFLATMAAVSVIAIATPAAAQYPSSQQNPYHGGQQNPHYGGSVNADANLSARIGQLHERLQAGVQSGTITRQEAVPLRRQLRDLTRLERRYARNGISGQERGELRRRLRDLRQAIRIADGNDQARWDRNDRDDGYGRYERDDGYGRYDRDNRYGGYDRDDRYGGYDRVDANRDGYDDRDSDRDGRWDDDVNDGRYPQQPARSGLGGIIDGLLGGGGLRVGQRATADLYPLQGGYRDQYRDGNGAYFRTDGRQIYQIDARSQTVVRIYPLSR